VYSRILVAVDGSDPGQRALREALKLAKDDHPHLRLLHAVDVVPPGGGEFVAPLDVYRQSCLDEGQEILDQAVALAREAGVAVESALLETTTAQLSGALIDEAKRWSADLIVLGTHGRGGLRRLLLGSVAEGVVRHAPVPVLLVRAMETTG
jgi:nucleotide-binding universal stress UspA family protein